MPPILLRCVGVHLLKLLSIAALLAGVLMWADHRVSAQDGKPAAAAADDKGSGDDQPATPAGDGQPGAKPAADADQAEEPAEPAEEPAPAAIVDTGTYLKPTVDLSQKSKESTIKQIATKGSFEGGEQADFDEFFQTYFFPSWADPSFIATVQHQRATLRTFFHQSRAGPVHDHLLALSMRFLKILAEKNFHPAARYNAMLAIGELNDSEPSPPNPAVPCAGRRCGAGGVAQERAVRRHESGGASRPAAALHVGNRQRPSPGHRRNPRPVGVGEIQAAQRPLPGRARLDADLGHRVAGRLARSRCGRRCGDRAQRRHQRDGPDRGRSGQSAFGPLCGRPAPWAASIPRPSSAPRRPRWRPCCANLPPTSASPSWIG